MAATASATESLVRRSRRKGRDWPAAISALKRLSTNKEDTSQVYAVFRALNKNAYELGYIRLLETPEGGRIAYERVELAEKLKDDSFRAKFPSGSFGDAYNKFLETEHLSMQGLIDESHKGIPPEELDENHPYVWFFRRVRDTHDLMHILTGYGRDALGEVCLLAFTYQEVRDLARAVISYGGFLSAHGPMASQARKAILEARRRGKAAAWLYGQDFEKLLFEPLEEVRRKLRLTPPLAYQAIAPELRDHITTN
ncbi:MAG: ubiquinone biosynthesis protein [Alphaproteobacteria bacterium]|nr:ubiquinone biosynthesis protein [Alphaproteobacteria bacterium]